MSSVTVPTPITNQTPTHDSKVEMTSIDNLAPMTKELKQQLQQITGKFLHLARAVDDTTMHVLNNLATKINTGTQSTAKSLTYFLNCCATHASPIKIHRTSDVTLNIHLDAAC